jgi:hypothetical protein
MGPLYSVAYPATTSDSVSEWSKGARLDSKNKTTKKVDAAGAYRMTYQYEYCTKAKSWKLADWDVKTSREYSTVTKMSSEITCTRPLIVAMIAYLEWLNKPTTEKNMLDNRIKIRWYRTIESTDSTMNMLGPQIKFRLKRSCTEKSSDRNTGAATVVGRGIRNTSFDSILNRSASIWKAPFRPIRAGPILRWAKASILRSSKTINKTVKTHVRESSKASSWIPAPKKWGSKAARGRRGSNVNKGVSIMRIVTYVSY